MVDSDWSMEFVITWEMLLETKLGSVVESFECQCKLHKMMIWGILILNYRMLSSLPSLDILIINEEYIVAKLMLIICSKA